MSGTKMKKIGKKKQARKHTSISRAKEDKSVNTDSKMFNFVDGGSNRAETITRVAFITDIHYGQVSDDSDNKTDYVMPLTDSLNIMLHAVFEYDPDYIVFGGDYIDHGYYSIFPEKSRYQEAVKEFICSLLMTNAHKKNNKCRKFFMRLLRNHKIIMIPGNHDIDQEKDVMIVQDYDKKSLLAGAIIPPLSYKYTQSDHPSYFTRGKIRNTINSICEQETEYYGESFIINTKKRIIIYAFNSVTIVKSKATKTKKEIPQICQRDMDIFNYFCNLLKEKLGETYENYLFIVALHHHTSDIAGFHEIKEFEGITNSGMFKKMLSKHGVKLVLHGHKHWPEVYIDAAVSDGGMITTVSGGTIYPHPQKRSNDAPPGFFIIDYDHRRINMARIGYQPLDKPMKKSEFQYYQLHTQNTYLKYKRRCINIQDEIYFRVQQSLITNIITNPIIGCSDIMALSMKITPEMLKSPIDDAHSYNQDDTAKDVPIPSQCATAIGICILQLTECRLNGYSKLLSNLRDYIKWTSDQQLKQYANSLIPSTIIGYSNGHDIINIECTCWIVRAFYLLNDEDNLVKSVNGLMQLLDLYEGDLRFGDVNNTVSGTGLQYRNNIYTLSFVLDVLTAFIHFESKLDDNSNRNLLTEAKDAAERIYRYLLQSISYDKTGSFAFWSERSSQKSKDGSITHTAYSLIACIDYIDEITDYNKREKTEVYSVVPQIKRWLFHKYNEMCKSNSFPDDQELLRTYGLERNSDIKSKELKLDKKCGLHSRTFGHSMLPLLIRAFLYTGVSTGSDLILDLSERLYDRTDINTGLAVEYSTGNIKYLYRTYDVIIAIEELKNRAFSIRLSDK